MRRDGGADLDEFVAGGNQGDPRQGGDAQRGATAGGGDGDFATGQPCADGDDAIAGGVVAALAVDRGSGLKARGDLGSEGDRGPLAVRVLVRHHAVGTLWQHCAGHHLDARTLGRRKGAGDHPSGLRCAGHRQMRWAAAVASGVGAAGVACPQRVAVERHAIKRRQRAIGHHLLPQHPAVGGGNRAVLRRKRDAGFANQTGGVGGRERGRR